MAKEKTPDQIRIAAVPVKHSGLINGFVALVLGGAVTFAPWALLHPERARFYRQYVSASVHSGNGLFRARKASVRHAALLRYALLRYGNQHHIFDAALTQSGAGAFASKEIAPVYSESPLRTVAFPLSVTLGMCLAGAIWGRASDGRRHRALIAGVPFDGSIIATVADYNKEVQGDGMKYAVRPWRDR